MAKITNVSKLMKESFKEAPVWFSAVMESFNNLIDLTLNALRGKLTFEDNYYCEVKTNTHAHAVELEIAIAGNYSGLLVIGTPEEVSNDYIITGWKARRITNQK